MGDRANVFVKEQYGREGGVYLYTHWGGTDLPETVQGAMKKKERWDDGSYLARIIFCQMVKGHENGETGFGISATLGDGDDRILVIDCDKQTVSIKDHSWTFQEFIDSEIINW